MAARSGTPADAAIQATVAAQSEAADPQRSAWVAANAGAGKTSVLTSRVLRLLLAGAAPDRILCLTYTKAAAAEMSTRIFDRLSRWVIASAEALESDVRGLIGRPATAAELMLARQLFARTMETPGGLKVQTIHAFCERLLQRFPLEAGVAPGFATLDDAEQSALLGVAASGALAAAARAPESAEGEALAAVVGHAAEGAFDRLLRQVIGYRDWLETAIRRSGSQDPLAFAAETYTRSLGLSGLRPIESIDRELASVVAPPDLLRIASELAGSSANDVKLAQALSRAASGRPGEAVAALRSALLTGDGKPRKSLMTKPLAARHPGSLSILQRAQDRFIALDEERRASILITATLALSRLADRVLDGYGHEKARRAALDFDDLIRRTASLLESPGGADWVLFKLDGGLDHILVDEAQDTSPLQWRVIARLAGEFFSGNSVAEAGRRTVFAVGDEKQSIYGFQGARPEEFRRQGAAFAEAVNNVGARFADVALKLSFRSVPPLLEAVDAVFADAGRTPGVTPSGGTVSHIASRIGEAGIVEVWETERAEAADGVEPWTPLADRAPSTPQARLAERIGDCIEGWLNSGERLASENRPIRPGDILILVRRRRPFAGVMVSALKARGIPVAGADRMRLMDQLAVQDLVALIEFVLLPEDDLALATVLKSPLVGLDDDDLQKFAPRRKGFLWPALLAEAQGSARLASAVEALKSWRARADISPPYEFLTGVLDRDRGRLRLLERLGPEASEAIDELLGQAIAFDEGEPASLVGFVHALRAGSIEVKRDMEHGRDEVRIMTVHGAKGLEAPIVFLPDTCSTTSGAPGGALLPLAGATRPIASAEPFLWPVAGTSDLEAVRAARDAVAEAEEKERNRLLYVALTRARDRIYVAGFEGVRGRSKGCWYDIIRDGVAPIASALHDSEGRPLLRIATGQSAPPRQPRLDRRAAAAPLARPAWATRPAPREPQRLIPIVPSRLAPLDTDAQGEPVEPPQAGARAEACPSPVRLAHDRRLLRGVITHALIEHLPSLPRAAWRPAAERFVAARGQALSAAQQASIVRETLTVLEHPDIGLAFGPESRAEVAIAAEIPPPDGSGPALRINGRIDRLVMTATEAILIDVKTNRPPPLVLADVPRAYVLQLAAYRLAVSAAAPGRRVRAALLWTDGPRLMDIPELLLDAATPELWTADRLVAQSD